MSETFEDRLIEDLLRVCTSAGRLEGELLSSPDLDFKWDTLAQDYAAEAVRDFNAYPEVAIAWAAYVGMGMAARWDKDWNRYKNDTLKDFFGERGWDDLDEHVTRDILGLPLNSKDAAAIASLLSSCAECVMCFFRHEGIEPGTADAYRAFIKSNSAMYRVGAALELKRMKYHFVPLGNA